MDVQVRRSKRVQSLPIVNYSDTDNVKHKKRKLSSHSTEIAVPIKKETVAVPYTNDTNQDSDSSDSEFEDVCDPIGEKMATYISEDMGKVDAVKILQHDSKISDNMDVMKMLIKCEGGDSKHEREVWEDVKDEVKYTPKKIRKRKRNSSEDFEDDSICKSRSKRSKKCSDAKVKPSNQDLTKASDLTEEEKEIRRFTNRCQKDRTMSLEQSTLVISIAYVSYLMKLLDSTFLQALFFSLIPEDLVEDDNVQVEKLLTWYRDQFTYINKPFETKEKKGTKILMMELLSTKSTKYEQIYALGFLFCFHVVGIEARLVASLYVPTLDKIKGVRPSPNNRVNLAKSAIASYKHLVEDVSFWVELKAVHSITSIDVCNGVIDNDDFIEINCVQSPGYVISMTNDLIPLDSTPKYNKKWSFIHRKARMLHFEWWDWFMDRYLRWNAITVLEHKQMMKKIMLDRGFPPSIGAFKHNLIYALEKDLLKMEAIYPSNSQILGKFKSHNVYSRDNVKTLKQIIVIKKEGRDIKKGEVPYKVVKQKIFYDRWPGDDRWRDLPLWGEWQTEWYNAPTAENGKVPRNEFGNVELFKPWMLPKKAVHIDLPGSYALARRLGNMIC